MNPNDEQSLERLPWLQSARQQSHALAELRAAHRVRFREERQASRRRALWAAALAAGVLGLASVTVLGLHGRRVAAPPPPPEVQPLGTPGAAAAPAPVRPAKRPAVAPAPRPAPRRSSTGRAARRARPAQTAATRPAVPPGTRTFEGDESGDLIIVTPPRKRVPLWTPEAYKKQRGGGRGF